MPVSHPPDRDRRVRSVLIVEGVANVLALIAKLIVGLATGSLAILGDALHSLSDVANNVIAILIMRHSVKGPDDDHPYGHRKFETLAVFVLATLLTVLAFELCVRALTGESGEVATTGWALAVMLGVLAINLAITAWEHVQAKRLNSDILHADAAHTLADSLTTLVVIVGWQVAARGVPWFDRVAAVGVAAVVLYLAYGLFKRAVPVLVDSVALDSGDVDQAVAAVEGVREVRRTRSRWIGQHASVDVVVAVDADLDTAAAHEIADRIEKTLEARFGVHDTTVHIEPFND
ncbi:MAG: cation diffusion facilitator family transporter [Planctomycetota bacterium]|nr:cation diffusion facilitator family transporter [Planctomycetota bacterium]